MTEENQISREAHLNWCKQRALEYCRAGDLQNALASMGSDLGKHPKTAGHLGISLGLQMMMAGQLSTPAEMEKFILGFN